MYLKIKEYGLDLSSIQENINYYKYYFPKDYVKLNTKDWVITQLKPMVELSLKCIDMFTVIEKKLAKNKSGKKIMSKSQIKNFIMHYERITRQMLIDLKSNSNVVVKIDKRHKLSKIKFN